MKPLKETLSEKNRKKLLDIINDISDDDFNRMMSALNNIDDSSLDEILDNINLNKYPNQKKNIKRLLKELISYNTDFKEELISAASGSDYKHNGCFTLNDIITRDNIKQFEIYNRFEEASEEIINYDFKIGGSARGKFELFLALFMKDARFGINENADIICTDDVIDKIEVKCVYTDNPALPASRTANSLNEVYYHIGINPKDKIFQNENKLNSNLHLLKDVDILDLINGFLSQYKINKIDYISPDMYNLFENLINSGDVKNVINLLGAMQLKAYLNKNSIIVFNKRYGKLLYRNNNDILEDILFFYNNLKFNCPGGNGNFFKIIDIK